MVTVGRTMKDRAWIALLVIAASISLVRGQNCTELVAAENMVLSGTFGAVGGPVVNVSCEAAYKLHTNQVQKFLACTGGGTWDDTVGFCINKTCPAVSGLLSPVITASTLTANSIYDVVELTCDPGLAFYVDYWESDVTKRIKSAINITCQADTNTLDGYWPNINNCTVPTCRSVGWVKNGMTSFADSNINTTGTLVCRSGHYISVEDGPSYPDHYHLTATCNEYGQWVHQFGMGLNKIECKRRLNYVGCMASGELVPAASTVFAPNGYTACYADCKARSTRFMSMNGDTCICGDNLVTGWSTLGNANCDQICPGYDQNVTSTDYFCGGTTGEEAVYSLTDGCFEDLVLTGVVSVVVPLAYASTCMEMCRGEDTTHSILYLGDQCACVNATDVISPTNHPDLPEFCDDTSITMNGTYYSVSDFLLAPLEAEVCDDLFAVGVRVSGMYYLDNPLRKQQCYFKDGTACDPGWIGNGGWCYYFHTTAVVTYDGGRAECLNRDADPTSIWSQADLDFMNSTRTMFEDVWADRTVAYWWNGLTDGQNDHRYLWVDGGLMTFNYWYFVPFRLTLPFTAEYENYNRFYAWDERIGTETCNLACRKAPAGPFCVDLLGWSPLNPNHERDHPFMSLTYCIQYCKGQQLIYMLVRGTTCYCTDTLPAHNVLPRTSCNAPCPSNPHQYCGGTTTFDVRNVTMYLPASSCRELEWYGISNGTYDIAANGLTPCPIVSPICPFGWLTVDGRCYIPVTGDLVTAGSEDDCRTRGGFLASFETSAEHTAVYNAINGIPLFLNRPWRVGARALSRNMGRYRWASGRPNSNPNLAEMVAAQTMPQAGVTATASFKLLDTTIDDWICEIGQENVGCYDGTTADPILSYAKMTIQLCAETCRGHSYRYAYINSAKCACAASVVGAQAASATCLERCGGQYNQFCGDGVNLYTVLDLDYYAPLFTSCNDALGLGIFLSGNYSINGNITECLLVDGGECPYEWLSINGSCHRHFPKTAATREQICRDAGATQVSITSLENYNTFKTYINEIDFNAGLTRVFTGISRGVWHINVYISSDGLLTDQGLITSNTLKSADLSDTFKYISFNFDTQALTIDGGVICKENKYVIGCYTLPAGINYTVVTYNSMEMGMCRQVCIGQRKPIFVMGSTFCGCIDNATILATTGSAANCDVSCPIHADQRCGDGSVVWAYHTGEGDFPYAKSCAQLYKNGIFYEADYMIGPDMASATLQKCGFSDNTECPREWFGVNGSCYSFYGLTDTYAAKQQMCAAHDAYLFNPIEQEVIDYTSRVIADTSGLFIQTDFYTGITPTTFNTTYVASTGKILIMDAVDPNSVPINIVLYNFPGQKWINPGTSTKAHICQRDPEYLGCYAISSAETASFTVGRNSLTHCTQLCLATNASYAAVSLTECRCYESAPIMTSAYGNCTSTCPGEAKQFCGAAGVFNIVNITTWTGVTGTCETLYSYGLTKDGFYLLRPDDVSPFERTFCFFAPILGTLRTEDIASQYKTSTLPGYTQARFSYGFGNAWRPLVEDPITEFVMFTLTDDYIINGVTLKGLKKAGEDDAILTFSVHYFDSVYGIYMVYTEATDRFTSGCQAGTDICTYNFLDPFVTYQVSIIPQTWVGNYSVQVELHGEIYKYYEHEDRYVGCVIDRESTISLGVSSTDLGACIDVCTGTSPFAAFDDHATTCYCGTFNHFKLGFQDDSECVNNDTHWFSSPTRRALYRTNTKKCDAPDPLYVPNALLSSVSYTYTTFVNTFTAQAQYACNPGYLPPVHSVVCLQNNSWSWPTTTCEQFTCPNFTVANGNVSYTHLYYLGVATVMCDPGFYAENVGEVMVVTCEDTAQWTITPTCSVDNLKAKMAYFTLIADSYRTSGSLLAETTTRSRFDCVARCLNDYYCTNANYQRPPNAPYGDGGNCRLFNTSVDPTSLLTDTEWDYVEFDYD